MMTGMYATVAVLAALTHRDGTGEGQHIDMALLDVQVVIAGQHGQQLPHQRQGAQALGQCARQHRAVPNLCLR